MAKRAKDQKLVTELHNQISNLTEALQRERADSVNLRKRTEEERSQLGGLYKAMVIRELLPAIDNLERALTHAPKDLKDRGYVKGVQGVFKQFENVFNKLGVKRIETVGEYFDPHLHEAISIEGGSGKHEIVAEEVQAGYMLDDEVIRPALVKVKKEK